MGKLFAVPITRLEAQEFVAKHHRHHGRQVGDKFCIGAATEEAGVVGVAVVSRPVSRVLDDGFTAEVTRLATNGHRNACSFLYARCWRAARAMGYRRLITYTLSTESGSSLRGAGWKCLGEAGGGSWSWKGRPRVDTHPTQRKIKWESPCQSDG